MSRPDHIDATSKVCSRIASDPITWLPFLPLTAAYAFFNTPGWLCLGGAAFFGSALFAWWRTRWRYLHSRARVENLKPFLSQENAVLAQRFQEESGRIDWRWCQRICKDEDPVTPQIIREALEQKKLIESRILDDGILTDEEEEISRLVSELAQNLADELMRIALVSGSKEKEAGARDSIKAIREACQTISRTAEDVDTLIDPLAGLDPTLTTVNRSRIHQTSDRLQERLQQAAAIKRRVAAALQPGPESTGIETPPPETKSPEAQ